jgi:FkbM family methyltransferase
LGANSTIRKITKSLLFPLTNETSYVYLQAASKAWDIKVGTWSEPELDLVKLGLQPGETALDIGANYGIYSYFMSRAVGRKGRVFSFEPVPFTFASLKVVSRLLSFGHNVELINKGCSNENSKITFTVPVQESGALVAGLSYIGGRNDDRPGKDTQVRWGKTRDVEADVVRLDDFLPDVEDLPFVKMDIEGAELFCLKGAERTYQKHLPTTICEINPWYLEGFGVKTDELTGFFMNLGYQMFFYSNDNGASTLREVKADEVTEDNYLFLHPSRSDRFRSLL